MPCQLTADCLNEIFEYLEVDEVALCSCLLVNRLWCEVSVRILWKNIQNYDTLFACLPNESKEILHKNEIFISTPTSKPPLFNYVAFIKNLSIHDIDKNILIITPSQSFQRTIMAQEIFKMFMNQTSLKSLNITSLSYLSSPPFTTYPGKNLSELPGATDSLKNLSELKCRSDISSECFYQLYQTCHNIQSLNINLENFISNGLLDLISIQRNLKYLNVLNNSHVDNLVKIFPSLTNLPNTIIKLDICGRNNYVSLSFLAKFTNLQELVLSFYHQTEFFKDLQHVIFPHLQILKFFFDMPNHVYLIKFLKNNGKNLKEICLNEQHNNSLNLAVAEFCPNLKSLYTIFDEDDIETLKVILTSCQQLESLETWCGETWFNYYLNENELLEVVVNYSPEKFYELKLHYDDYAANMEIFSEELEFVFINWAKRISQRSLSLIIFNNKRLNVKKESMEVIEDFKKLGVIKKFEILVSKTTDF